MDSTSHYIDGIINNVKSRLVLTPPYPKLSKTSYKRWVVNRLNHPANSGIRQYYIRRRDKKIAKLEQEYRDLMTAQPRNVARLSQLITDLGRLWNAKVRDEQNEVQGIGHLQKAADETMREGVERMAKARSKEEVNRTFIKYMDKVRHLMDE